MSEEHRSHEHHREIHYTVDTKPQETNSRSLTPYEIMQNAGVDPKTHYLVLILEHGEKSYKDDPEAEIEMKDCMEFFTNKIGPTPVSWRS